MGNYNKSSCVKNQRAHGKLKKLNPLRLDRIDPEWARTPLRRSRLRRKSSCKGCHRDIPTERDWYDAPIVY